LFFPRIFFEQSIIIKSESEEMEKKRSSSLQNYLDNLDKQSLSSDEDEWGFFVDMEHKSKSNAISIRKKVNVNHYHYHYQIDDVNHHDRNNEDEKYKERD
jgi:hypothetical protein